MSKQDSEAIKTFMAAVILWLMVAWIWGWFPF